MSTTFVFFSIVIIGGPWTILKVLNCFLLLDWLATMKLYYGQGYLHVGECGELGWNLSSALSF